MGLPQTQGAKIIYLNYLEPYVVHHENQIDEFITLVHNQLNSVGFGYLNVIIEFVREKVLRQQSPQPPPQQTGAGNYSSYANDLMSRFLMPQARPSADQPAGGRTRGMDDAASVPDSLATDASNKDSSQRAKHISDQRERLTGILRQLESEQQNIDLAYGSAGSMPKSRSATSFVNVDHDDFQPPPPVTGKNSSRNSSGGNWGQAAQAAAGFFGGDDKKGGRESSGWSAARDITAAISSGLDRDDNKGDRRR